VWERFLSRTAHGGNLPCHVSWLRPGEFFWARYPRVGIPIGDEARRSKGHHPFPDTCLTTSLVLRSRDSGTMVSGIPRLRGVAARDRTGWPSLCISAA
jgi:hypothetical protein